MDFLKDIPKVNLPLKATYTGWWYTYPSEKYEFVSWDDYSQYMEKNVPNHQPVYIQPISRRSPAPCLRRQRADLFGHAAVLVPRQVERVNIQQICDFDL